LLRLAITHVTGETLQLFKKGNISEETFQILEKEPQEIFYNKLEDLSFLNLVH